MRNYKFWTTSEILTLKSGLVPKGRSITACRRFCARNNLLFPGKKTLESNIELLKNIKEKENKND